MLIRHGDPPPITQTGTKLLQHCEQNAVGVNPQAQFRGQEMGTTAAFALPHAAHRGCSCTSRPEAGRNAWQRLQKIEFSFQTTPDHVFHPNECLNYRLLSLATHVIYNF